MTINERIKELRKALGLTQIEFGQKTGISQGHMTGIESGKKNVTDKTIKVICLEFNVNEEWLRTGQGEMFTQTDTSLLEKLVAEYRLDSIDAKILETYIAMPDSQRKGVKAFMLALCNAVDQGATDVGAVYEDYTTGKNPAALLTDDEIEAEAAAYAEDLRRERDSRGKSSASGA